MSGGDFSMVSVSKVARQKWRTVRELMDERGEARFGDRWTGEEFAFHRRLGLRRPWPEEKDRGKVVETILLHEIRAGDLEIEVRVGDEYYAPPKFRVRYLQAVNSSCADWNEEYVRCLLRYRVDNKGRKGHEYGKICVRVLEFLEKHGTSKDADEITRTMRIEGWDGDPPLPSYSRLQSVVSAVLDHERSKEFAECNSAKNSAP
jgi:hypothetical protein